MLGSVTPIPQAVITGNSNLYLGSTVGTDNEMTPRVQLGSVPFATQALTVPDGSNTESKLADDLFNVYSTVQSTGQWDVPSCGAPGAGEHVIPGMTLEFTTTSPRTALIDVGGLGHNPQAEKAVYSMIYVNGELLTTAAENALLGGCRNSSSDSGTRMYCGFANSATVDLEPGTHKIEAWVDCDGSETVKIFSGSLRALLLPK